MFIVAGILPRVNTMPSNSSKASLVRKRKLMISVKSEYCSALTKLKDDKQVRTALT